MPVALLTDTLALLLLQGQKKNIRVNEENLFQLFSHYYDQKTKMRLNCITPFLKSGSILAESKSPTLLTPTV
jgi:hypothetical protein